MARRSGRAPNAGSQPSLMSWSFAAWVTSRVMLWAFSWSRTRLSIRSTISRISSTRQAAEDDRCVDPVQELGPEAVLQLRGDLVLHQLVGLLAPPAALVVRDRPEAEGRVGLELLRAEVRGHDDDRVPEVDPATLGVRQLPVLEDLEQDVEHLGVGLLDLVEEHDRVALAPDRLGQLAALVEPDVAGRGTDEPGDVVALHELAHVDLDEGVLAAEHELGEGLGELGLPDAGGAEEDERADRALRVLEAGAGASDGLGDDLDRLLLADDAVVQGRPPCAGVARSPPRRCG